MPEKQIISALCWLLVGLLAGIIHMAALWLNVQFLMRPGKRPVAIAMLVGRFFLLGGLLYLAARSGTAAFLWATGGVLVARPLILRFMKARLDPDFQIGEEGPLR